MSIRTLEISKAGDEEVGDGRWVPDRWKLELAMIHFSFRRIRELVGRLECSAAEALPFKSVMHAILRENPSRRR